MRRSVFGIWIGLLALALSSATIRFILFAARASVPPTVNLVFSFVIVVLLIVAVWMLALRFIEGRQRRQTAAMQSRYPGSVTFPSLPTRELDAAARLLDPTVELDGADALTVLVDATGLSIRHRGADSTALLLEIERTRVLDVRATELARGRTSHPAIAVTLQSEAGLLPLVFPAFQPLRPFHRASPALAAQLAENATEALGG